MYTENFMSVMVMPISVISDLKNKLQNNKRKRSEKMQGRNRQI